MAGAFRGAFSGAALFYVLYTLVSLVSLGMIIPVWMSFSCPKARKKSSIFPRGGAI
jgi:hypothetical protein